MTTSLRREARLRVRELRRRGYTTRGKVQNLRRSRVSEKRRGTVMLRYSEASGPTCRIGQILRIISDGMKKKVRCLTCSEVAAVGGRAPRKGTDPWTV